MKLTELLRNFKDGDNTYDGHMFIFKIKENERYETYYTVSLSVDIEYRDVFLSSAVVYKDGGVTMYECWDGHQDDCIVDIKNGLYDKLDRLPMIDILNTQFEYDRWTGCLDNESLTFEDVK